jgi:hypothetical protein
MSGSNADTVADAARRYTGLRRRFWRSFLGAWGVAAMLGFPLVAFDSRLPPGVRNALGGLLVLGFMACWFVGIFSWRSLTRFRCPRCGGLFLMSQWSSWPTSACKH